MSDRGRYDYDIATGERNYGMGGGREAGRNRDSMFGYGGGRDDDDRSRGRRDEGEDGISGRAGSGRASAYDHDDRQRGGGGGRWTQERENISFGRGRGQDRDEHRGEHEGGREQEMGRSREHGNDRGERMSSGWGFLGGGGRSHRDRDEDREHRGGGTMSRDRDHERDRSRESGQQGYGPDDQRGGLPINETSRLIASNKVEGTSVYGSDGARLGSIYNFMVDKRSGKVEYAVMSYGGMLGMNQRYYPLPWEMLTYDTRQGGYHVDMRERDLRDAPSFDRETEPRFDQDYSNRVHGWYGTRR